MKINENLMKINEKEGVGCRGQVSMVMDKEKDLIKKDLMAQLEERGMTQTYYKSLVDDYISLWDVKNELIKNIEENGVMIEYKNGANQYGTRKNDCVPELTKVNGQMLKLLSELGLRGADIGPVEKEYTL